MKEDLIYKIALTKIPYVGLSFAKKLVAHFGDVPSIFKASKKSLSQIPRIHSSIIENIVSADVERLASSTLAFCEKHDIQILFFNDKEYPTRLSPFSDSPIILYYKGKADLNPDRMISIVGTRKPTEEGKMICEKLIEGLASFDVTIISGLAYGIDVTAHNKCLALDIPTIGVLGHGLSKIYPAAHLKIARKMQDNGGLLTQFPPEAGPDRQHFPMRNKVVAGLSDAVIVIETPKKGGSMITAQMGNDYNKDVFAVPGRNTDPLSAGCNHLIKTHKAHLLQNAEDIGYILSWNQKTKNQNRQTALFQSLSKNEQLILDLIADTPKIHIDLLMHQSGITNSKLAALVLELEFKGQLKALPGKRFMLT